MSSNSIWQPNQPKFSNQLDLKIDDLPLYHCSVFQYSQSHRVLTIKVHKHADPENIFYLVFEAVWYFQGPTSWRGLDFEFADINERKTLIQKVLLNIEDNMVDGISEQFALYVIYRPDINIQILAGNCFTLKSPPIS